MQKKVFITGATGLVGSRLCKKFLEAGYEVLALRRRTSSMKLVAAFHDEVQWYEGDLLHQESLRAPITQADYVIHVGAMVSFSSENDALMQQVNVQGTSNMLALSMACGCEKFFFISSVASLGTPRAGYVIDETTTMATHNAVPRTMYASTKFEAEKRVWEAASQGLDVLIVNPSVVLGVGDWGRSSGRLIDYVFCKPSFYPVGCLNVVDLRDLVDIIYQLLESPFKNERYIVSSSYLTYQDFFQRVAQALQVSPPSWKLWPWLAAILWRLERIRSRFHVQPSLITRESMFVAASRVRYDNAKIQKALTINFRSLHETLQWVCTAYLAEK